MSITGWWFGTFFSHANWECHRPNWRTPSFFRGVGLNHQTYKSSLNPIKLPLTISKSQKFPHFCSSLRHEWGAAGCCCYDRIGYFCCTSSFTANSGVFGKIGFPKIKYSHIHIYHYISIYHLISLSMVIILYIIVEWMFFLNPMSSLKNSWKVWRENRNVEKMEIVLIRIIPITFSCCQIPLNHYNHMFVAWVAWNNKF